MIRTSPSQTIRAQELMGRQVYDAVGNTLGRVYDLETERDGDELRVTALRIGIRSWLTRFGWTDKPHGRRVPWERIAELSPHIRLL